MPYIRGSRTWTRSDLAAILGVPLEIPLDLVVAILGETRASIRSSIRTDKLQTRRVDGRIMVATYQLLAREGYELDNVPMMLRVGELVPRPSFDRAFLRQTFGTKSTVSVREVQRLTNQTREEVLADLSARRLRAYRGFQPPWSINLSQFEHGFAAGCY
jgi:hypothetical protein